MCNLLKIKHDEKDEDYELVMEDDDEECDNLNYLVEQFLFNSVEFVNSSGLEQRRFSKTERKFDRKRDIQ